MAEGRTLDQRFAVFLLPSCPPRSFGNSPIPLQVQMLNTTPCAGHGTVWWTGPCLIHCKEESVFSSAWRTHLYYLVMPKFPTFMGGEMTCLRGALKPPVGGRPSLWAGGMRSQKLKIKQSRRTTERGFQQNSLFFFIFYEHLFKLET